MMAGGPAKIVTSLTTARKGRRATPLAGYVVLELVNGEFLLVDGRLDEVADRHEPHHAAVLDDRQMPATTLRHQRHALLDGAVRRDADDVGRHDQANRRVSRRAAQKRDFARVVALAEDAQELVVFDDEDGADVVLG